MQWFNPAEAPKGYSARSALLTRSSPWLLNYNRTTYPEVLKTMANLVEPTPKVRTYDVAYSTFHKIAARVAA